MKQNGSFRRAAELKESIVKKSGMLRSPADVGWKTGVSVSCKFL